MTPHHAAALAASSPHTFTIQYPPSRHYFRQHFLTPLTQAASWCAEALAKSPSMLLYIHVPFCAQRCFYCNFAVDVRRSQTLHSRYIDALATQLERFATLAPSTINLPGLDIGGGTPTHLSRHNLERLAVLVHPWVAKLEPGRRASIETTPRVVTREPEKLHMLIEHGITRASMGLQSTNDETLASVNRRQQRQFATTSLHGLASAGFERTSVDLVFGLPGQTPEHFKQDLQEVMAHDIDAITIYDCLYRGEGRALPGLTSERPSPRDYARMYDMAWQLLADGGYDGAYGGVNFCRHSGEHGTSDYFRERLLSGTPYIGMGNYASSMLSGGKWWFAPYSVDDYIEHITRNDTSVCPAQGGSYELPEREHMAKHILANLNFGIIYQAEFAHAFGKDLYTCFAEQLDYCTEQGWLERCDAGWAVIPGAFEYIYAVRAMFYTPKALDWVHAHLEVCT